MTVKECYDNFGGDYDDVLSRLRSEERIRKFLTLFLRDASFSELVGAFESGNAEVAFRAAHTLKGICGNLALKELSAAVVELTEALRNKREIGQDARPLYESVKAAYETTAQSIRLLSE